MSSDGRVKALDFEEKYVHNIYDSLATHRALADRINATVLPRVNLQTKTNNNHRNGRSKNGKCWGKIVEFLKEFSNTSIVGDIGFGDGRFLEISGGMCFGVERCLPLCQHQNNINNNKSIETIGGDVTRLPFRSNTFDGLICVAVLHHLATRHRRVAALKELSRVLAVGGRLLVTVFAVGEKQDEYGGCDVLIPVKRNENKTVLAPDTSTTALAENNNGTNINQKMYSIFDSLILGAASQLKEKLYPKPVTAEIQSWMRAVAGKMDNSRTEEKDLRSKPKELQTEISESNSIDNVDGDQVNHEEQHQKYYHIFTLKELTSIFQSTHNLQITESYHLKGSWVYILTKTNPSR